MKKTQGMTLLEVLITILIISILASVAGPSFRDSFEKQKLVDATESLYSYLQLTRSEALMRSKKIYFSSKNLNSTNWFFGISETQECDPSITDNTNSKACVLRIDDGDGVEEKADDLVLFRVDNSDYEGIKIRRRYSASDTAYIGVDPARGVNDLSSERHLSLQSENGDWVHLTVTKIGKISVCSDDLSDYKACS